jgi:hypothetical protein
MSDSYECPLAAGSITLVGDAIGKGGVVGTGGAGLAAGAGAPKGAGPAAGGAMYPAYGAGLAGAGEAAAG